MSGQMRAVPAGDGPPRIVLWCACLLLVLGGHVLALRLLREIAPVVPPLESPAAITMELAPPDPPIVPAPPAPVIPVLQPPPPVAPQPMPPDAPAPPPPDPIPDIPVPPEVPAAPPVIPVAPPRPPRPPRLVARPVANPPAMQPAAQPPAPAAPPAPPAAPAPSAPSPNLVATWQSRMLAHLERFKQFPMAAQRRGEQGVVLMRFHMDRSGHVLSATLVRGSGYEDLDVAAQGWIARADPMPALPPEMTQATIEATVPLRFVLQ